MLGMHVCCAHHVTPRDATALVKLHLCPISFVSARFTRVTDHTHCQDAACMVLVALNRRLAQGALRRGWGQSNRYTNMFFSLTKNCPDGEMP
jgi:hypothetical protein